MKEARKKECVFCLVELARAVELYSSIAPSSPTYEQNRIERNITEQNSYTQNDYTEKRWENRSEGYILHIIKLHITFTQNVLVGNC